MTLPKGKRWWPISARSATSRGPEAKLVHRRRVDARARNEKAPADSPRPVIYACNDRYGTGFVGQSVEYGHHEQCLPTTASRSPTLSLSTAL